MSSRPRYQNIKIESGESDVSLMMPQTLEVLEENKRMMDIRAIRLANRKEGYTVEVHGQAVRIEQAT